MLNFDDCAADIDEPKTTRMEQHSFYSGHRHPFPGSSRFKKGDMITCVERP